MIKKYTEHLETTNDNMKRIHESGNPVREPSSNCNIHLISKNDEEIDERYFELDSDLKNNELFDFVDLDQYAPNDPIKKHNFIQDIQLPVPAGLYRYPHANDQIGKEIEERLRLMISLEDPSIIVDLRTNNGFKGSKFDIFWDELDGYFNEHNNTVVNER
ncbi:unnamed protein product [Rhizophagus irregularis]|nr:unnamed protein product [Rhizophagus irregularis]